MGSLNNAHFRVVVIDRQDKRDGRFIEEIGSYHPERKEEKFQVNLERARYWVSKGATPSDTVRSMLKRAEKAEKAQKS
jgi:small subunit ribosomal protein S16